MSRRCSPPPTAPFDRGNPPSDRATAFTFQGRRPVLAGNVLTADGTDKPALARLKAALIFADGFDVGDSSLWSVTTVN